MPPSSYAMPVVVKWFSVVLAFVLGAGYAFGPASFSSSPVFGYAKQLLPINIWGVAFIVCGGLLATTAFWGYFSSALVWMLWEIFLALGSINAGFQSWGAVVWPLYFAALNFMHVYKWGMERRGRMTIRSVPPNRHTREEDR